MLLVDQARICSFDERYAAMRDGRIFSRAVWGKSFRMDATWRELRTFPRKAGRRYLAVTLGKGRIFAVHRLVAGCFHGASEQQIRHLDGDPRNNRIDNLAYGTAEDNAADRERHGRTFKRLNYDALCEIARLKSLGMTNKKIATHFNVGESTVGNLSRKRSQEWAAAQGKN